MNKKPPFRFTLLHLFALISYFGLMLGLWRFLGLPSIAVHLSLLFVFWVTHRFSHAHIAGTIPLLLGIDILICNGISWGVLGLESYGWFPHRVVLNLGSILIVVAILAFVSVASIRRNHWRVQAGIAVVAAIFLVGWRAIVPSIGATSVSDRQAVESKANNLAMKVAVDQVEGVVDELGRVPDESELKELLVQPLPSIIWQGWETRIKYDKIGDNRYQLWYYVSWDIYYYDSSTPEKGWGSEPF